MAVIEVGLGGRLDCTNIITPELSVITNISFDHTQFLGNTLALIAGEKAGIIKPHVPVVIGEDLPETRPCFQRKADECGAPIVFAKDHPVVASSRPRVDGGRDYQTTILGNIHGDLGGDYQEKNMNTVLTATRFLKETFTISDEDITRGLANVCKLTGLRGRWETLCEKPHAVCDTGHNVGVAISRAANKAATLQDPENSLRHGRRQGHKHRDEPAAQKRRVLLGTAHVEKGFPG